MTNLIVNAQRSSENKVAAEEVCERINDALGYRAADPDYHTPSMGRLGYYSGGVKLSKRAAAEVAARLEIELQRRPYR